MNNKPWGVNVISVINILLGLGVIGLLALTGYFGTKNLSTGPTAGTSIIGSFGIFLVLGIVVGIIILDSSFATFNLKKRALSENTLIAVIVLLVALGFLFIDFSVPANIYTGGEKPILNLPLHILFGVYAIWNMYYLRKPAVRSMFVR